MYSLNKPELDELEHQVEQLLSILARLKSENNNLKQQLETEKLKTARLTQKNRQAVTSIEQLITALTENTK